MKNFKNIGSTLSRNEMRSIEGGLKDFGFCGSSCTLTIIGSDGRATTSTGTCVLSSTMPACYCDIGFGQIPVTSNGGASRCQL